MNTKTIKKKKIITALIALTLVVSFVGCDKAADNSNNSVDAVVAATENESVEYTTASDSEDITQPDVTTTTTGSKETTTEPTTEGSAVTSSKTKAQTQKKKVKSTTSATKASVTKATIQKVVNQSPITTYATAKVTAKATTAKKTTKKPVVTTKKVTTVKKKTTTAKKTTKRATTTNYWCDDGGTHHVIDVGVIGWHKTYEEAEKAAIAWSLKYLPDSSISYQVEECDACGLFTTLYIIDNDKGVTY